MGAVAYRLPPDLNFSPELLQGFGGSEEKSRNQYGEDPKDPRVVKMLQNLLRKSEQTKIWGIEPGLRNHKILNFDKLFACVFRQNGQNSV